MRRNVLVTSKSGFIKRRQTSIGGVWSPRYSGAVPGRAKTAFRHIPRIQKERLREVEELVWKFKLYRDDDTTIRDEQGNITTASGLPIDIYGLDYIYIKGWINPENHSLGTKTYRYLPGLKAAYNYWTYSSGVWTYGELGKFNVSTNIFTIYNDDGTMPLDDRYWIEFRPKTHWRAYDPGAGGLEFSSTSAIVDEYNGAIVVLTRPGVSQTLPPPTIAPVTGHHYTVKACESNGSYTININGVNLSAGEHQNFVWNNTISNWQTASVNTNTILFGLNTQYPYIYKEAEKLQAGGTFGMGYFKFNIPYWYIQRNYIYSEQPALIYSPYSFTCEDYTGLTLTVAAEEQRIELGIGFFKNNYTKYRALKTSIPYKVRYGTMNNATIMNKIYGVPDLEGVNLCSESIVCMYGYEGGAEQLEELIVISTEDGTVNKTISELSDLSDEEKIFYSDWIDIPGSIDSADERSLTVTNNKPHSEYYYICKPDEESEAIMVQADLVYIELRQNSEFNINFIYDDN